MVRAVSQTLKEEDFQFCLVGKVLAPRLVNIEAFKKVMKSVWKVNRSTVIDCIGENIFFIKFLNGIEKNRVFNNGPWFFDKSLILLDKLETNVRPQDLMFKYVSIWVQLHSLPLMCFSRETIWQLGLRLGEVEDVEMDQEGDFWGRFARVRVRIDITRPLHRGLMIITEEKIGKLWIPCRYEKIPEFCYWCGCIGHTQTECVDPKMEGLNNEGPQYGPWMRASEVRRSGLDSQAHNMHTGSRGRGGQPGGNWRENGGDASAVGGTVVPEGGKPDGGLVGEDGGVREEPSIMVEEGDLVTEMAVMEEVESGAMNGAKIKENGNLMTTIRESSVVGDEILRVTSQSLSQSKGIGPTHSKTVEQGINFDDGSPKMEVILNKGWVRKIRGLGPTKTMDLDGKCLGKRSVGWMLDDEANFLSSDFGGIKKRRIEDGQKSQNEMATPENQGRQSL